MSNGNTVILVGNITRDPELRYTPTGLAAASFSLAVNRRWQNRQTNEWEEATSFFEIICWRELAENTVESLTKGMRVIVTGRLEQRTWETAEGEKRNRFEIVADDVGPSLKWVTAAVKKAERQVKSVGSSAPRGPDEPDISEDEGIEFTEEPF